MKKENKFNCANSQNLKKDNEGVRMRDLRKRNVGKDRRDGGRKHNQGERGMIVGNKDG